MELVAVPDIWNAIKAIAAEIDANLSGKTVGSVAAPFLEKRGAYRNWILAVIATKFP
jgi:hypothetical protein